MTAKALDSSDPLPTLRSLVGWALTVEVGWALLAALWNAAGVVLVSQGHQALGPTAPWFGALVLLAVAGGLIWSVHKLPLLYAILSLLVVASAAFTVWGTLRGDPSLWPTPFWRWAGAALNCVGAISGAVGLVAWVRWMAKRKA